MKNLFLKKNDCSGCTACYSICPKSAITMRPDEEGFLYPVINQDLCIDCGLCKSVCPFDNDFRIEGNFAEPEVYAAKHCSLDVRMQSTSGGMFTAISDHILDQEGVVYGASFDPSFKVIHIRATTSELRDQCRGSKYVQSDLNDVFKAVKKDLLDQKQVLFTGTPCQTAGLYSFLCMSNINIDKLVLCDLVCLGVSSPKLFSDFITFLEKKHKSKLKAINFRNKEQSWHKSAISTKFLNGMYVVNTNSLRIFQKIYYSHLALRPSCSQCGFSKVQRPSDLTIADYWGIEKMKPHLDDDHGTSLVLINSEKGLNIFSCAKSSLIYESSCLSDCVPFQLHLRTPSAQPPKRMLFMRDYEQRGFQYVIRKYAGYGFIPSIFAGIKKIAKGFFVKFGIFDVMKKVLKIAQVTNE